MTALNVAETLLAAQLKQAGIPFEREYCFAAPKRRWRADFMVYKSPHWPLRGRFLIEIDGGAWTNGRHVRGRGFAADLVKLNAAALMGFRVLRFTPAMVGDGTALSVIRQALGLEQAA